MGICAGSSCNSAGSSSGDCATTTNVGPDDCGSTAGNRYSRRPDATAHYHRPADAYHDQSSGGFSNHDASTTAGHGPSEWNNASTVPDNSSVSAAE